MSEQNFPNIPPLPSLISIGKLLPIEWYNEKKMKVYEAHEIIEIIEMHEFIIACLIKAISFLKSIGKNTAFITKIDEIYNNKFYYSKRYFNLKPEFNTLFSIIRFIDFKNEYFYYGVIGDEEETKNLYESWNYYYTLVFGESTKFISIMDKNLIGGNKKNYEAGNSFHAKYSKKEPSDYTVLAKLIKIPKNDYVNFTLMLLNALAENKNYYQKTNLDTALKDVSILKNKMRKIKKDEKIRNGTIDYRDELFSKHGNLKEIFNALKNIENDKGEYYIVDNDERKRFSWNDTKVFFCVFIMKIFETQRYDTDFWRPFDNAFDAKFRDSAKQYLDNLNCDGDKNLEKANELFKMVESYIFSQKTHYRGNR